MGTDGAARRRGSTHHLRRVVLDGNDGEAPRQFEDGRACGVDARFGHGHLQQRLAERHHPRRKPSERQHITHRDCVRLNERPAYLSRERRGAIVNSLTSALSSAGSE